METESRSRTSVSWHKLPPTRNLLLPLQPCFTTQTCCRPPTCYLPTDSRPTSPLPPPSPILIRRPVWWLTLQLSCRSGAVALFHLPSEKKKKQQIPFDFLLPQSVVWLCIMSVGVCLVLLALSCLPAASPTECEELTKPLEDQSQVGCPRLHIGKLRNKQRTNSVA